MQNHTARVSMGTITAIDRQGGDLVLRFADKPCRRSVRHGTLTFTGVGTIESIDERSGRAGFRLDRDSCGCSLHSLTIEDNVARLTILKHEDHDLNPVSNRIPCGRVVVDTRLSLARTLRRMLAL